MSVEARPDHTLYVGLRFWGTLEARAALPESHAVRVSSSLRPVEARPNQTVYVRPPS